MIAEHEEYFATQHNLETRRHGIALVKLIRDILKECKACPHRVYLEKPEEGMSLWQTMHKRIIQEALKHWPETRNCAYKLGISINQFHGYINRFNIDIPEARQQEE